MPNDKLPLPIAPTLMDKLLARLDAKSAVLLLALMGSNGAWVVAPRAPTIPVDQYTAVVVALTNDKVAALADADRTECVARGSKKTKRGHRP